MPAFTKTDFRALDALVAEQVMGWRWMGRSGSKFFAAPERLGQKDAFAGAIREAWDSDEAEEPWWLQDPIEEPWAVPQYSTEIEAAMDVLCAARQLGRAEGEGPREFMIASAVDGYLCDFHVGPGNWLRGFGATISEAICQAAVMLADHLAQ